MPASASPLRMSRDTIRSGRTVTTSSSRRSYARALLTSKSHDRIHRRGTRRGEIARPERRRDQWDWRQNQHPGVDDGDVFEVEVRAQDHPADHAGPEPQDEALDHGTVTVL